MPQIRMNFVFCFLVLFFILLAIEINYQIKHDADSTQK